MAGIARQFHRGRKSSKTILMALIKSVEHFFPVAWTPAGSSTVIFKPVAVLARSLYGDDDGMEHHAFDRLGTIRNKAGLMACPLDFT